MKHVLFLHIPKTGGVSVETLIRLHDGPVSPAHVAYFIQQTDWAKVHEYKYFFSHTPLCIREVLPQPLFTFTFLRDPVDRAISAYNHMLRAPEVQTHQIVVANGLDFVASLKHPVIAVWLNNVATRMLGSNIDLRPVSSNAQAMHAATTLAFETTADEFTYRRALKRLGELDFVGFTERFDEDCRDLAALLGLKIDAVPFENAAPQDHEWPLPRAVRSAEAEKAVRKHSYFDCCLYEEAWKLFGHTDSATARGSARLHFARRASSQSSALFGD